MTDGRELQIESMGSKGHGVAFDGHESVYVPFALPGETWRRLSDQSFIPVALSDTRRSPECEHFGTCGGCVAQHMPDRIYEDWKTSRIVAAFAHNGIEISPRAMWRAEPGTRRRVAFGCRVENGSVQFGYRAAGSHELIDLIACPIACPAIVAAMPLCRDVLRTVGEALSIGFEARLTVLEVANGLDVGLHDAPEPLSAATRAKLAELVARTSVIRLRVNDELIVQQAVPEITIGKAVLPLSSDIFLQATAASERFMTECVVTALKSAKRVVDLFCGAGTFTFPLAERARLMSVDSAGDALEVLELARRHTKGLKPIEVVRRDLFMEPLSRMELNRFDGIVFDPPRAGAAKQAESIAKSKVATVVAVSCNPATLARDARILIDGGYELRSVQPIDQFLFSEHVEAVAVFKR